MTFRPLHLVLGLSLMLAACTCRVAHAASASRALAPTTADHLQTAHAMATRGVETFTAFATKADSEGFSGVASFFRAAARSQQINADAFAKVMGKLKVEAKSPTDITPIEVKSTKDNLAATVTWVAAQRSTQLPAAMTTARTEGQREAEMTFKHTREALTEVSRFSRDLGDALDASRTGKKDYFVCRSCGYLVSTLDFQKCPVDYATKDNFERVN